MSKTMRADLDEAVPAKLAQLIFRHRARLSPCRRSEFGPFDESLNGSMALRGQCIDQQLPQRIVNFVAAGLRRPQWFPVGSLCGPFENCVLAEVPMVLLSANRDVQLIR